MEDQIKEFDDNKSMFDSFQNKIKTLFEEVLAANNIRFHKLEARVKDRSSLLGKIERKHGKYEKLGDITDIVGMRLITFFDDEVDQVSKIIEKEFEIDKDNSVDRRNMDADKFGYKSLHFVVSFNNARCELTEFKRYKGLKCEIQVRSLLQHAWAEIEHDLGYKSESSVPEQLRRDFFRVAALLESADKEFVSIKNRINEYKQTLPEAITTHPQLIKINADSLAAFCLEKLVESIDYQIAENNDLSSMSSSMMDLDSLIEKLDYFQITTIQQLDSELRSQERLIVLFSRKWLGNTPAKFSRGISILYLCYVLIAKNRSEDFFIRFLQGYKNHDGEFFSLDNLIKMYQESLAES